MEQDQAASQPRTSTGRAAITDRLRSPLQRGAPRETASTGGLIRRASDSLVPTRGWARRAPAAQLGAHLDALVGSSDIDGTQQGRNSGERTEQDQKNDGTQQDQKRGDEDAEQGGDFIHQASNYRAQTQLAKAHREAARLGRMAALTEVERLLQSFICERGDQEGTNTGTGFYGPSEPVAAFEALMHGKGFRGPQLHGAHPGLAGGQGNSFVRRGRAAGGPGAPESIERANESVAKPQNHDKGAEDALWTQTSRQSGVMDSRAEPSERRPAEPSFERPQPSFERPQPSFERPQPSFERPPSFEKPQPSSATPQPSFEGPARFPGGQAMASQGGTNTDLQSHVSTLEHHGHEYDDRANVTNEVGSLNNPKAFDNDELHRSSLWRLPVKEYSAEAIASMLLVTVGCSVNCQVGLSGSLASSSAGQYSSQNWAWGLAVVCTVHLAGGISGAHCNPGITFALAVFRGFPWQLVPGYMFAQWFGSFLGAGLAYAIYYPSIDAYQGHGVRTAVGSTSTGGYFVTVPEQYATPTTSFVNELVASAILAMVVFAIGDDSNSPPGDGMSGLILGLAVVMIGMSLGWQSGYAINAARDFGPRVMLSCVGYDHQLWTHNAYWWIYGPIVGTLAGAVAGATLYDLAIYSGGASPLSSSMLTPRLHSMVRPLHRVKETARRRKAVADDQASEA